VQAWLVPGCKGGAEMKGIMRPHTSLTWAGHVWGKADMEHIGVQDGTFTESFRAPLWVAVEASSIVAYCWHATNCQASNRVK
jgi:hypothetical protein